MHKLTLAAVGAFDGAGDSVRARVGRTVDVAPFAAALGMLMCLKLGDVLAAGLVDGLVGPAIEGGW
jgi:hypothetical protein